MPDIIRGFIYARKSTDTEDRQVYSIDHQLKELRELAVKHNIEVITEFTEQRTAKTPGRPVFNEMLGRIKKGHASCILAWHPDRLARNGVDGGAIINLVDTAALTDLKFATFWFEPSPQGMLMLSIAFGMSKYYVDSMSQGIKRAYKRRLADGFWPHRPPTGYFFDRNTRTVVLDPDRAPLVRHTFELYAAGDCTLLQLTRTMSDLGLRTRPTRRHNGLPLSCSQYHYLLQNPFYAGILRHRNELFDGKHPPIVSLSLFDRCQIMLAQRGRRNPTGLKPFLYRRMFRCAECGSTITNETTKGYTYLRCTKQRTTCAQPYAREESIRTQIAAIIRKLIVPPEIIDAMLAEIAIRQSRKTASIAADLKHLQAAMAKSDDKQRRLTEVYVDGTLPATEFRKTKEKLVRDKRVLAEKVTFLETNPNNLFEPVIRFIRGLTKPQTVVTADDPQQQADFFKKVCSNLRLNGGRIMWEARGPWKHVVGQRFFDSPKPVATGTPTPGFSADASFPPRCSPPNENRTTIPLDAICRSFKDNPGWE